MLFKLQFKILEMGLVAAQHLKKQVHGAKVDVSKEQMVFAEATSILPLNSQ